MHKATGYWCKKIRGKVYYFGRVSEVSADDALAKYLRGKPYWERGEEPPPPEEEATGVTVADLVNHFLAYKEGKRDAGELAVRSWRALYDTCAHVVKVFGRSRIVDGLTPNDFAKLKAALAKGRGACSVRNEMQRVRCVFRYALDNRLIDRPPAYGSQFDKPPIKQVRRERRLAKAKNGSRMFDAAEIRAMLSEAKQPLRTMVLLAVNAGMGAADLSELPLSSVDLDRGILDYPRIKTETDRLCVLWPETIAAIRDWLARRPKAKSQADDGLLFLTVRGARWLKVSLRGSPKDAIGQEFKKVCKRLGIKRAGLGFYGLRRSFRTVADEALDRVATDLIMGHVDVSMAGHYREHVTEARLRAVVEHVRRWLFPEPEEGEADRE